MVEPSDDVGTLTVAGNYTQAAAGDLLIAVTPTAASLLKVGGAATLGGDVTFAYAPGTYAAKTYTFLQASGLGGSTFAGVLASTSGPVPTGFAQSVTYTTTTANLVLAAAASPPPPPPVSPPPPPPPPPVSPPTASSARFATSAPAASVATSSPTATATTTAAAAAGGDRAGGHPDLQRDHLRLRPGQPVRGD
ncbi:MAG: hypothetical protein WDM85_04915 [Caulobacteraceae bacterium]